RSRRAEAKRRARRVGARSGPASPKSPGGAGARAGGYLRFAARRSEKTLIARLLIGMVRLYQWLLSPVIGLLIGKVCRFEPSCSRYAVACLETHGAGRGSLLSIVRLCKCHPFHPGGFDPPPPPRAGTERTIAHGP